MMVDNYSVIYVTQLSHLYHFLAMVTQMLRMKGNLSSALC